jgi:hypothetical protein
MINSLEDRKRGWFILFGLFAGALFTATIGTFGAKFVWGLAGTDQTSPPLSRVRCCSAAPTSDRKAVRCARSADATNRTTTWSSRIIDAAVSGAAEAIPGAGRGAAATAGIGTRTAARAAATGRNRRMGCEGTYGPRTCSAAEWGTAPGR